MKTELSLNEFLHEMDRPGRKAGAKAAARFPAEDQARISEAIAQMADDALYR